MTQGHKVIFLKMGQQPPVGSTGIAILNGAIVWIGELESCPAEAVLGTHVDTDPVFETTYDNRLATQEEIDEYENILANPEE